MSKLQKLLQRIKNNPKTVRFEEMDKILIGAGYEKFQPRNGSSHYVYRKAGRNSITIPYKTPYIGEAYVRDVIRILGI